MTIEKDNRYEFVPPIKDPGYANQSPPRGRQCGECGLKFDHSNMMAHCCANLCCPMGFGTQPMTRRGPAQSPF